VDSMGSIPNVILDGASSSFGDFDECLEISSPIRSEEPPIEGKYCLMKIIVPFPKSYSYESEESNNRLNEIMKDVLRLNDLSNLLTVGKMVSGMNLINGSTFHLGICIPSNCNPKEVENSINQSKHIPNKNEKNSKLF